MQAQASWQDPGFKKSVELVCGQFCSISSNLYGCLKASLDCRIFIGILNYSSHLDHRFRIVKFLWIAVIYPSFIGNSTCAQFSLFFFLWEVQCMLSLLSEAENTGQPELAHWSQGPCFGGGDRQKNTGGSSASLKACRQRRGNSALLYWHCFSCSYPSHLAKLVFLSC